MKLVVSGRIGCDVGDRFSGIVLAWPLVRIYQGVVLSLALTAPLWAGDPIEPGDELRIVIMEDPQFGRDAKVDVDGNIVLPHLGGFNVAGKNLDQIREVIKSALIAGDLIRKPTVLVEVASYRPVFVGGAVVNPGAVAFEPGLSVRHVLILAGGLDRRDEGLLLSTAETAAAKSKLRASAYDLAQVNSLIQRLDAELERQPTLNPPADPPRFVPQQDAAAIVELDVALLTDRLRAWTADRGHMQEAVSLVDVEVEVLKQQIKLLQQESAIQQTELTDARSLFERNLLPRARLQEIERESLVLSRLLLESQSFLARANQNRLDRDYDLASAETKWRISIQSERRKAMQDRNRLTSEVELLRDRIVAAGMSEEEEAPISPEIIIYRTSGGQTETLKAKPETEVRSGDVLDVRLSAGRSG